MLVVTPNEAKGLESIDFNNTEAGLRRVTSYLGTDPSKDAGEHPSAFLVQFTPLPGKDIRPHFHKVVQFQVVVAGDGVIGGKPTPAVSFHYADPLTPYGPIAPTEEVEKLDFFTLRPIARAGVYWMPAFESELTGSPGRDLTGTVPKDTPLPNFGVEVENLIQSYDDGLAGFVVRFAPNASDTVTVPENSSGQYLLVTRGSLSHDTKDLPSGSLMFAFPGEEVMLGAGDEGAEVLVTRFPVKVEP